MAAGKRLICAGADLRDGAAGVRFEVRARDGELLPAFAVRHGGLVRAYVNRCPHADLELDWLPGEFFDAERLYLICAVHGALYDPSDGRCAGGPCRGEGLAPLPVAEQDGQVYLVFDEE